MLKRKSKGVIILALSILFILPLLLYFFGESLWRPIVNKATGKRTVAEVLSSTGSEAEGRLKPYFEKAGVKYAPDKIALLAFKDEKRVELWALEDGWRYVRNYKMTAASGAPGPKLKEGDKQVPEGIYKISSLNPNSSFYLSMKVDYPNEFDLAKAKLDNRTNLGGDIFIHGKASSVGCIAIGDEAIEELFVLVATIGRDNVKVIIAPNDLRTEEPITKSDTKWLPELYNNIKKELEPFKAGGK